MPPLRGCLIGCGYVSQFHLAGWARQKLGRLTAVCDLDESRARAACQHGVCTAYTDAREMLERERPDFVEICTRPGSHARLVRLAAEYGAHVLCQKPIAATLGELDAMISCCTAAGVRFMVHENFRWRAWYQEMKQAVAGELLGQVFRLGLTMHDQRCLCKGGLAQQPYFAQMPRLILYEIGPHAVDLARFFLGEARRVACTTRRLGPQAGEDVAFVTLTHENGAMSNLDLSWATAGRNTRPEWGLHDTWLEGTKGTLRLGADGQLLWQPVAEEPRILPVAIDPDPMVEGYARTQEHFLECLISCARFQTDGADTRQTMRVIFAAYESAASGLPVSLVDDGLAIR